VLCPAAAVGAVLTHANLIADAAGTCALLTDWNPGDRHISYLPLAHIYERNNVTVTVHLGGSIGFYSGNVQELLDDVLVGVQGLWECLGRFVIGILMYVMASCM
jgi:acyl-CoA synthetase (AMP-forming)/AMP-acid ligase II